ncbi:hypothetical protein ABL254_005312, partial [Escherichia coli]
MKIISVTGITVLNTEDIHFFSDSSEKKTGRFYLKKQSGNYNCPVRGSIPSYKLMQAADNIPEDITFKAYYLSYKKNNGTLACWQAHERAGAGQLSAADS